MKRKKKPLLRTKRCFTLLEVMIAIAILTIMGGALWWRIDRWLDRERFESDISRLQSTFRYAQALAINTNADWQMELDQTKEGCKARLVCIEDSDRSGFAKQPSPFKKCRLFFDDKAVPKVVFDFFSTGRVTPKGVLKIALKNSESKREFSIPGLFQQGENETCINSFISLH